MHRESYEKKLHDFIASITYLHYLCEIKTNIMIYDNNKPVDRRVVLEPEDYNFFLSFDEKKKFKSGILIAVEYLKAMLNEATDQLKGKFSTEEWKYMADIIRFTPPSPLSKSNPLGVSELLRTSRMAKPLKSKYNLDVNALTTKVAGLTNAQTLALVRRIDAFWLNIVREHPNIIAVKEQDIADDLTDFAKY